MRVRFTTFAVALALSAGCDPYYAPPLRAVQYGAPARLEQGRVELGVSAGGLAVPDVISPHLGVGLRDWVAIEAGGNFTADFGRQAWALGFVGPRFSYAPHRERSVHLISDLELGVGAGVGGVRHGNELPGRDCPGCDGLAGYDRVAGGGYVGVGLGAQIAWFSLFARGRIEATTASNVPSTAWPSASVGMEINLRKRAALTVAGGYIGYFNDRDFANAWFYQLGVTFFIDAFPRRREPAPPSVTPPRPPPPSQCPPCADCDDDEPVPDDGDESDS
ncbi:MAG TPA: hypothetical protein VF334_02370 [Polyangia bacterium]